MHLIPVAILAVIATTGTLTAPPAPNQASFTATTPAATLTKLAEAYDARSLQRVDALLTADYRFHFAEGDAAGASWVNGLSREFEMSSTESLFASAPIDRDNPNSSRLDSLSLLVGEIEVGADPEHPDSTCQCRLAVAHDYRLRLVFADSKVVTTAPTLHVFHVVRGDAAVRMPGQLADTTHWYIRRWFEDVNAITVALGKIDGECSGGLEASAPASPAPALVGLRAIGVPLCPTLRVLCDLPGPEPARLEVYDIQGRRVAQRMVTPGSPGSVLVEAGGGQRFTPGAYWVRLTQGARPPVTKPVMVAR